MIKNWVGQDLFPFFLELYRQSFVFDSCVLEAAATISV